MEDVVSRHPYQIYFKTALIFVSFIIFFGFRTAFGMDMENVQAIADNLKRFSDRNIKIVVEESTKPDAYLHPMGYIVITNSIINLCESDAEIAFILGHELGHSKRGHYNQSSEILGISREAYLPENLWQEIDADSYSVKIMKAAGYDPAASLAVLAKLKAYGIGQSSYMEKRIKALLYVAAD